MFVAEMNTLTNAGSDSQLDVVKTENMIKSMKSMFHGVDKAVLEEFVEAGAAMFATGVQMRVVFATDVQRSEMKMEQLC